MLFTGGSRSEGLEDADIAMEFGSRMMKSFNFLAGSLSLENRPFHMRAAQQITAALKECEGYISYKLTTLGRASDDDVPSFMIVTKEHGIVLIDIIEDKLISIEDKKGVEAWTLKPTKLIESRHLVTEMYEEEVKSRLKNHAPFYNRKRKSCIVPITTAVVFCNNSREELQKWNDTFEDYDNETLVYSELLDWINALDHNFSETVETLGKIYSLLEGTFIYENKDYLEDEKPLITMNDYIQQSLMTTFKQDESQRLASMQLPPGPQRIRGLAGTGKTIVLSLKAAITHKKFENYKVLYLFNTQSLYQQVQSLISRYYTLEAKKTPEFESKLRVLHAWGGRQRAGLYSELCRKHGLTPLTLSDARGHGDALAYIYKDLLDKIGDSIEPEYDLVLIDEAQDFPLEVFQVIFKLAKGVGPHKRIIWAYDEFQSLRDTQIKEPEELFGRSLDGEPNMPNSVLDGEYAGGIPKDFVLPNCYRTPRPVLMTAHGVALGLYTKKPNEMFYHQNEWKAIGYQVNVPNTAVIAVGNQVEIERTLDNNQNKLEQILNNNRKKPLNLIQTDTFKSPTEQYDFIAQKINNIIQAEKVTPEEIVIINLHSGSNKAEMLEIQRKLLSYNINSVIPGYVESADIFKRPNHVTITTPFRAKGNEANVIFVLNAHLVANDFTLRMRNAFFVAVTRSRGWCYITGIGAQMDALTREIESIKQDFPKFKFICPDQNDVKSRKSFLNKSEVELNKIQSMLELVDTDENIRKILEDHIKSSGSK